MPHLFRCETASWSAANTMLLPEKPYGLLGSPRTGDGNHPVSTTGGTYAPIMRRAETSNPWRLPPLVLKFGLISAPNPFITYTTTCSQTARTKVVTAFYLEDKGIMMRYRTYVDWSSDVESGWNRRQVLAALGGAGAAFTHLVMAPNRARAAIWPERPVTVVVMYSAGGGTDTVIRTLAGEMAKSMGWTINVVNKPGAVGGVATRFLLNKPADGYWWLGAANYNKFVRVMGHSDSKAWEDWQYFQAANSLASWSVRSDSPFKTFEDVVTAAKQKPGQISISTSGTGGLWQELTLIVSEAAGIKLKYVPYKGGKPATLAGLQGEVDIAGGGVHEHIEFIKAGKLRNLQQTGRDDLVVPDVGTLRSVGAMVPSLKPLLPLSGIYNIALKRDTPTEILQMVESAFVTAVESDAFSKVAQSKYFDIDIRTGEAADRRAAQVECVTASTFYNVQDQIGKKVKSPKDLGLPAPADFDAWWPPKGYTPRMG